MKKYIAVEIFTEFFQFLDVSPQSVATYQRALKQMFKFLGGKKIAQREDIIAWKKSLEKNHKPATIGLYLAAAKRFFSWVEHYYGVPNIARDIKAPKRDRGHKRDFFDAAQLRKIFAETKTDSLRGKRDYAILALLATCGLRTIEIVRANIEDIRHLGGNTVLFVQGKGRSEKNEFVKLSRHVENAIQDYLLARENVLSDSEPLFVSLGRRNKNGRLVTRTVSQIAKHAMINAGYNSPKLTAHSLRHSAVTLSLLAGASLQEVQAFARHSDISTTTIYAHNVDRLKSMCEFNVSQMIFPAENEI